jgi:hypothetical protein
MIDYLDNIELFFDFFGFRLHKGILALNVIANPEGGVAIIKHWLVV